MSFGKMQQFIDIKSVSTTTDDLGFNLETVTVLKRVRAYVEQKNGTAKWINRAAFSKASVMFRLRAIPGITITTAHVIDCNGVSYSILSAEDVRLRGRYIEILAERLVEGGKGADETTG